MIESTARATCARSVEACGLCVLPDWHTTMPGPCQVIYPRYEPNELGKNKGQTKTPAWCYYPLKDCHSVHVFSHSVGGHLCHTKGEAPFMRLRIGSVVSEFSGSFMHFQHKRNANT